MLGDKKIDDELLESVLVSLEVGGKITDAEYFNLKDAIKDYRNSIPLIDKYKSGIEQIIEHCYSCAGEHAPPEKEIIRIAKSCLEKE